MEWIRTDRHYVRRSLWGGYPVTRYRSECNSPTIHTFYRQFVHTVICQCLFFGWGGFLRPDCTGYATCVLKCLDSICILGLLYFKNTEAAATPNVIITKEVSANLVRALRTVLSDLNVRYHFTMHSRVPQRRLLNWKHDIHLKARASHRDDAARPFCWSSEK